MSQPKHELMRIRKEKCAMRDRCLEYIRSLETLLNAKGQNGTLLNTYELSSIQTLLFYTLRDNPIVWSLNCGSKARDLNLNIPEPISTEERIAIGKNQ